MEPIATCRTRRFSSCEKLVAIGVGLLAVVSPLFIDRRPVSELELEEESINLASWVPLLLLVLILATALSLYLDRSFTRFDPYWIHRFGGSSGGIMVILVILALVLKCKASNSNEELRKLNEIAASFVPWVKKKLVIEEETGSGFSCKAGMQVER
ncbi:unnamed protein product [Dovyalis caffra]|uniref:Transmembrane protein n=1 Tax=Dovyalis caffra TaxID=77055 RepID=A0AAV1SNS2_9ROSI|nr:unnamed protein product [Dovyalis caffra]